MKIISKILLLMSVVALFTAGTASATHNRAGEITYKHISGYRYQIIVYTYCYTLTEADRQELEVDCGDGTGKITVTRDGNGTILDDENAMSFSYLKKNVYYGEHTFSGPGTYVLYMEDPNRNDGVSNIPNSVNVVFSIKTTLKIDAAIGNNSSPELLNAPMDKAALNKTFVHNPGAYDPDGDSLSYRIATCLQQDGQEIVGYTLPPVSDSIYVNPVTGDFVWERPTQVGTYNVAMWIEEWRDGVKIGQILRDIQVDVIDTDNHTPIIDNTGNHCVLAGDKLEFNVTASDPDHDMMRMEASGGPLTLAKSPATFETIQTWTHSPVGHFTWQTTRDHIRRMPYELLIKVYDDDWKVPLTAYRTINIRVIAPHPNIEKLTNNSTEIKIDWNRGGNTNATGYKIYRKDKTLDEYEPGICETGIREGTGYHLIAEIHNGTDTMYVDDENGKGLPSGFVYTYRVTAIFADGAESQPSPPMHSVLVKGIIAMTNVSVNSTDELTGDVTVKWTRPLQPIDPALMVPPFKYKLQVKDNKDEGVQNKMPEIIANTEEELKDTTYINKDIDTKNYSSAYLATFFYTDPDDKERNPENPGFRDNGATDEATSVFLKLTPSDRRITITHEEQTPWRNDMFEVYRKDPDSDEFVKVGETDKSYYVDYNLENGTEYGYKIKTIGYYSAPGLPNHIENWSQEAYATPIDTIAPCVNLTALSYCDDNYNMLTWHPDTVCGLGIEKYMIFYSETLDGELSKLDEVGPNVLEYKHYPTTGMAGCYVVAARDSAGNVGLLNNKTCLDMCDYYRLPNVFTPNGDGKNDLYHPLPYQFVDHIEMTITNRWGKAVFETTDPDINWDGTDQNNGSAVPDGVYFYECTVYERRLTGLEYREIKGYITVFNKKIKAN
ncbi:MAG: gliding motility-associated C-terminal domain-containing protein [Bacteroidales bacterium]|nr:gliding motility-associated C-terminal domain-containing protein [Bacteroidales bacterium]